MTHLTLDLQIGVVSHSEQLLQQLATIALAIWPNWHRQGVSAQWMQQVTTMCQRGEPPQIKGMAVVAQLRALGRVIAGSRLVLILEGEPQPLAAAELSVLIRLAEWLAAATQVDVAIVLSEALAADPAIDAIRYSAITLPAHTAIAEAEAAATTDTAPITAHNSARSPRFYPLFDQPHPESPGEQRLAQLLAADAELHTLFRFNQPLKTVYGSCFVVDLLWSAGRLVVEIDGFRYHSSPTAFEQDRQRDFELLLSGYYTIRLTHTSVMKTPEIAIAKIRDAVRWRYATL